MRQPGAGGTAQPRRIPKPVDKYVGGRVRMRRLMLGMSQTKLADALGVTFQQVQKYEKGTNRVSSSRLQQIADAMQVPVISFFEGAPDQFKATSKAQPDFVNEFLSTSEGVALLRAYTRLSNPKLQRSIVALVEGIVEEGPT